MALPLLGLPEARKGGLLVIRLASPVVHLKGPLKGFIRV